MGTGRLVVISPHLDDAVLSTGQALGGSPGAAVITVLAGIPEGAGVTEYDRGCGFTTSRQAMRERRAEDRRALAFLDAEPCHLDFLARGYHLEPDDDALLAELSGRIADLRASAVAGPIGIVHPDHERVARVWPRAARLAAGDAPLYAYEELPYRVKSRRRAEAAVHAFTCDRPARIADLPLADVGLKAQAMLAYASQLRFVFPLDCLAPERFWLLSR